MGSENLLFVSDLHLNFEHPKAFSFVKAVKKEYRVSDENVYSTGDLIDQYMASRWPKDPDGLYSPKYEIETTKDKIRKWATAIPKLKICVGNHDIRWLKKATQAEIPSQMMRRVEDVYEFPSSWVMKDRFVIKQFKNPILLEHGDDYGGQMPAKAAATFNQMNYVCGHHHSVAGVEHIRTASGSHLWGMVCGCLIDFSIQSRSAYAFEYARKSKFKPINGVGLVLNRGTLPVFLPMEGEWT